MSAIVVTLARGPVTVTMERHSGAIEVAIPTASAAMAALLKGPPGRDGAVGQAGVTAFTAAQGLSGHVVVRMTSAGGVAPADAAVPGHRHGLAGITTGAAAAGSPVTVAGSGPVSFPGGWNWAPGLPVFLGAGGLLTQAVPEAPGAAFCVIIGTAVAADTVFVKIEQPISLSP